MTTAHMKRRLGALDKERAEAFRAAVAKEPKNPTIPVSCEWMLGLRVTAENFGVPASELVDLLLQIGMNSFNRAIRGTGSNTVSWWLIEMRSKYPDTFNVRAWENSCHVLAIDKLYAERGVPIGKYQEWAAEHDAKEQAAKK
jgi:hypothetical protein